MRKSKFLPHGGLACRFPGAVILTLVLLVLPEPVPGQEQGHRLTLQKVPGIEKGTAAVVQGEAGPDGAMFYVEHLTMLQPVTVVLMAADADRPLHLNLSKYRFDQSDRSGDTGPDGAVSFDFRTQGELKIKVTPLDAGPGDRAGYYLIAWAGDMVKPELAPPVVIAGATSAGGPPGWLYALIGLAVLAAVAMVFLRKGRSR